MLRYSDVRLWYAFVAVCVVPVCLLVNPAQKIIYHYFRKRWHYSKVRAALATYRNFYLFAQVVIDKFAMYAGKHFNIEIVGNEHFLALASREEGFVQLSAHVGNYEIAGYSLVAEKKRFNALVFGGEKASVMKNRNKMFANTNINMIGIDADMSHLYEINSALANGEIVSMPGDRIFGSEKSIETDLLGATAHLPAGPFRVATMRGLDCLAVNVMKTGAKSYRIYVSPLTYDKQAPRPEQVRGLADSYARELERIITMYPEQWYNYFEFWN
jgi:predicted LPLAT superfamily acyltransferase